MNFNRLLWPLLLVCGIFTMVGCAPGLGNSLVLSAPAPVPEPDINQQTGQVVIIPVRIGEVTDTRPSIFIAAMNGRNLLLDGDLSATVRGMLENKCKQQGYNLSQIAETVIKVEVGDWFVDVESKFPASIASARASIVVTIEVPVDGKKFSAEYSGTTELKHPFLKQANIQEQLIKAMQAALDTAFSDTRLTSYL